MVRVLRRILAYAVITKNGFAKRYAAGKQILKTLRDIPGGRVFSHDLPFGIDALYGQT